MSDKKILTAPLKTDKMPPGIPYIIGNEAAERFNFYGMRAVLVVFMTRYLVDRSGANAPMNENEANQWYHWFVASNYFFPMLGAIVSDVFWGKYRTIGSFMESWFMTSLVVRWKFSKKWGMASTKSPMRTHWWSNLGSVKFPLISNGDTQSNIKVSRLETTSLTWWRAMRWSWTQRSLTGSRISNAARG